MTAGYIDKNNSSKNGTKNKVRPKQVQSKWCLHS